MSTDKSLEGYDEDPIPEAHKMRTNHLLVIAIDSYENGIQDLNNAVRDAETVRNVLWETYQFSPQNTVTLINEQATIHNIISTFEDFIEKLTPKDNFIFYFSGHGDMYKPTKRGFWIPADGKPDNRSSWLSNTVIKDFMEHMKAHHVFGIVDSCFSGALFRQNSTDKDIPTNINTLTYLDSYPSRWLLTAGRETIVEDGIPGTHSPFAQTLISQLQYNPNLAIAVSKLCNDVIMSPAIDKKAAKPRGAALPLSSSQGGEFIFYKKGYVPQRSATQSGSSSAKNTTVAPTTSPPPTQPQKQAPITQEPNLKDSLLELVRESEIEKALKLLKQKVNPDSRLASDLRILHSRHNRLKKEKIGGLITDQYYSMSANKITHALESYINDMEEEDLL